MIRFSLRQLTYFVAAAESGSTLQASRVLNVSQPAISMAINQLEETFEQKLFVRHHAKGIVLTPFGRRKLIDVRHLLAHATAVGMGEKERGLEGDLEIGVFTSVAPIVLPAVLRKLRTEHPGINVRVRESNLEMIYKDLESGITELALLYDLDPSKNMETIEIGSSKPYVVLPYGHELCKNEKVSLVDVSKEVFILIDMPYSRDYFLSLFRVVDRMPSKIISCASVETVRSMVAHNHGLSTLVTRPAGDLSYDGMRLECRPILEEVPPQRCIVGYDPRSTLTPIAKVFIDACRECTVKQTRAA